MKSLIADFTGRQAAVRVDTKGLAKDILRNCLIMAKESVPRDAKIVQAFVGANQLLIFVFQHESFLEVREGEGIPEMELFDTTPPPVLPPHSNLVTDKMLITPEQIFWCFQRGKYAKEIGEQLRALRYEAQSEILLDGVELD